MATTRDTPAEPSFQTTEVNATPLAVATPSAVTPTPAEAPVAPAAPAGDVVDQPDPDLPRETENEAMGVGVDGEVDVWESRYSLKNFFGRMLVWGIVLAAWIGLACWLWGFGNGGEGLKVFAVISGLAVGLVWLNLARRIFLARFGHYYRLTNRRLFVSTGVFKRRRDQMELLRVQDVFIRQASLSQRLLSVGTVVLVPNDQHLPTLYLAGVDAPKYVMDLVWHHARAERDRRSVKVDQI